MEAKATCKKCSAEILQRTADKNRGMCMSCRNKKEPLMVQKIDLGVRFTMAMILSIVFSVAGYLLGRIIWSGIGVILAIGLWPIGFIYGFFLDIINRSIRGFFSSLKDFDGSDF